MTELPLDHAEGLGTLLKGPMAYGLFKSYAFNKNPHILGS